MTLLSSCVVAKIRLSHENASVRTYTEILQACLADELLAPEEKKAIREYRVRHGVTHEQHVMALSVVGWTADEYEDGAKCSKLAALDPTKYAQRFLNVLGANRKATRVGDGHADGDTLIIESMDLTTEGLVIRDQALVMGD